MEPIMMLSLSPRLACSQQLTITGGTTDSIFPLVEAWLQRGEEHVHALQHVASRKDMGRYRSVVDFLFAELFPHMRGRTFAFYEGRGPQLRFLITEAQRSNFEARMIVLLEVAHAMYCQHRAMSWREAVQAVELLAA